MASSQSRRICVIFAISIWINFSLTAGQDPPAPVVSNETAPATPPGSDPPPSSSSAENNLLKHYEALHDLYLKGNKFDCKVHSSTDEKDKLHHRHWGTLETLMYLSGKKLANPTLAEELMIPYLPRLREFLARVGYLQNPGSLVFLVRQNPTLRLSGCNEKAGWRQQGQAMSMDEDFQKAGIQGSKIGIQAPNSLGYIHKYTCFTLDPQKCSHTFYVISKPLPDLPTGLQVREGNDVNTEDAFSCGVQYCKLRKCVTPDKHDAPRRSYPPYEIKWMVPDAMKSKLGLEGRTALISKNGTVDLDKVRLKITWDNKMKSDKEKEIHDTEAGEKELMNSFEEKTNLELSTIHSRIEITNAESALHSGMYECVIIDGNGVVSVPNQEAKDRSYEFLGDANIHVMPKELLCGSYGVAVLFVVITVLIIIVCPAKLEHDDGTRYKKDEMVASEVSAQPPKEEK